MKKIILNFAIVVSGLFTATSCIEEINPQTDYASKDQTADAPNAYQNFVDGITSSMIGQVLYNANYPYDFGYPTFFQKRDDMGQDVIHVRHPWVRGMPLHSSHGPSITDG